jgi:pimeloyl-ACP methyl ester carboxylesterase
VAGYFAHPEQATDLTPFRVNARVQQSVWESLGELDLADDGTLGSIGLPTLITHGRQDPIPLASSEEAARAMDAELVVIEDCGHVPYVEQPEALFAAIERFLADNSR